MKVLVDTNVLIDIVTQRSPFFADSFAAVQKCIYEKRKLLISAHSVLDLIYICRKEIKNGTITFYEIKNLLKIFKITGVRSKYINDAFSSNIKDFEDAIVEKIAIKERAKLIITRNAKDFVQGKIQAVTPTDFISGL